MSSELPGSARASSFGTLADDYDRLRPRYPGAAIDYALHGRAPARILDLGAGTGLLTRDLLARAPEVLAVEPDEAMRAVLAAAVPEAVPLAGTAEHIPVPDASLDAVLVGQAFHWFRRPDADHELARVLRPGGVVALLWNIPDYQVPWVAALRRATDQPVPPEGFRPADLDEVLFTPAELRTVASSHELPGPDGVIGLAHTWSWVITRSPDEQRRIDRRLRILITQHAELQQPVVRLPMHTRVVRQYLR